MIFVEDANVTRYGLHKGPKNLETKRKKKPRSKQIKVEALGKCRKYNTILI